MTGFPLQLIGLCAGLSYVAAAVLLMSRPVLARYLPFVSHARYKTRVPGSFFVLGSGIVLTVLNVYVVGVINAAQVTLIGYVLMISGAAFGLWICWLVLPVTRPDLLDEE